MSVKRFVGKVVSNKMIDTVVVAVELPKRHPIYGKMIKNTKKIKAHVLEPHKIGDIVEIMETKPFSKQVSFVVVQPEKIKEKK